MTTGNIAYDIQNILKGNPLEYIDLDSLLEEEDFEEMDFDEQYIKPETKKQKIALGLNRDLKGVSNVKKESDMFYC